MGDALADRAQAHFALAERYFDQRRYDAAIDVLHKVLEARHDWSDAHAVLAMSLAYAGKHDEAQLAAAETLRLDPQYWRSHYALSIVLSRRGLHGEAIRAARDAIALAPQIPELWARLAYSSLEAGQLHDAHEAADAALRLHATNASMLALRALVHDRARRPLLAEADIAAALAIEPTDPYVRWVAAQVARRDSEVAALPHVRAALTARPEDKGLQQEFESTVKKVAHQRFAESPMRMILAMILVAFIGAMHVSNNFGHMVPTVAAPPTNATASRVNPVLTPSEPEAPPALGPGYTTLIAVIMVGIALYVVQSKKRLEDETRRKVG